MMMYQILCGHVNYALGKTRLWVKKNQKDTLFWIQEARWACKVKS
jgi:hypothetical protein